MATRAGEAQTEMRALAKHIVFNCILTPSGAGTWTATASIPASDLSTAGAVQSGTVGTITDAGTAPNPALPAVTGPQISFELKDGYAQRWVGARGVSVSQTGGNKLLQAVGVSGGVTANRHIYFTLEFRDYAGAAGTGPSALTPAVGAGTLNVLVEVDYE